jgi:hypothetical protein
MPVVNIVCNNITDDDSPAGANGDAIRSTHSCAQSYEDRRIGNVRIVILVIVTSSNNPPSTVSKAKPLGIIRHTIGDRYVLKSSIGLGSNLILPVVLLSEYRLYSLLNVPSSKVPSSYPLTWQLVMITFRLPLQNRKENELFKHIPSSNGEFTVQLETLTFLQSISNPSICIHF